MRKKFFLVGFILLLLVAVPVTVFLVQREQKIRIGAAPTTTLSFDMPTRSVNVNETFALNILMNTQTNSVGNAEIHIKFDPDKLTALTMQGGTFMPSVIGEAKIDNNAGTASIFVVTPLVGGVPLTQKSDGPQPVTAINFKAKAETGTTPTTVSFSPETKAFGETGGTLEPTSLIIASSLSNVAQITIGAAAAAGTTPTPTPTLPPGVTPTPTPTGTTTPTPTPTSAPGAKNKAPDCNSLTASPDKGNIPLTVTLTANANDQNDDVTSATFTFGDGQTQTVDKNIGQSGSFQVTHVYQNTGTIKPQAIVKDINGAASDACTDTLTIAAAGTTTGGEVATAATPTPVAAIPTTADFTPTAALTLGGSALLILGVLLLFVL